MGVNKVVKGDQTLIDLTEDTVTADKLLFGYTAHGADGELIVGTYVAPPEEFVVLDGTEVGVEYCVGLTGFNDVSFTSGTSTKSDISFNSKYDGQYVMRILKIGSGSSNYATPVHTDARIAQSNEMIDFTGYSKMKIVTALGTDGSSFDAGIYCRITDGTPTLPTSDVVYDWTDWETVQFARASGIYIDNIYNMDISQISGSHYLCFGAFHGTQNSAYTTQACIRRVVLL